VPPPPPAASFQNDCASSTDGRSEVFYSLVMDNLHSDTSPRPDPPGSSDFVFRYIDAISDGAGTASTLTDPPRIEYPSEKQYVTCLSAPNSPTWPKQFKHRQC